MPKFKIEQIALCPKIMTANARQLLCDMGLDDWSDDHVKARGEVFGGVRENEADLAFNYQANPEGSLELEILNYTEGDNWMFDRPARVSHLGMHCSAEQLEEWREFFDKRDIEVAQEVITESHTNPAIKDSRRYNYVIFDTYSILGVDVKFIVRLPYSGD